MRSAKISIIHNALLYCAGCASTRYPNVWNIGICKLNWKKVELWIFLPSPSIFLLKSKLLCKNCLLVTSSSKFKSVCKLQSLRYFCKISRFSSLNSIQFWCVSAYLYKCKSKTYLKTSKSVLPSFQSLLISNIESTKIKFCGLFRGLWGLTVLFIF